MIDGQRLVEIRDRHVQVEGYSDGDGDGDEG